jgi:hypothetical protein
MKKVIIFVMIMLTTWQVNAQNNVGIGTSTPHANALLHVDLSLSNSKGIIVSGIYDENASIPDLGAGSRLMFYPGKAAFRAGTVTGTDWNNANVGLGSAAMGYNTLASGSWSFATGNLTNATGGMATAMGHQANASGLVSTAFGVASQATGIYSTAMGNFSKASGHTSTAMGYFTTASGNYSTAIGTLTRAEGYHSTAMGDRSIAKGYASTVVGMYNDSVIAFGQTSETILTPLFIVGNGDGPAERSNALVVRKTGNVGIGSNASISSALLELNSTSKGFLPPRMTAAQRAAIASPVAGLIVYETDNKVLYQHDGSIWRKLLNSSFWNSSDTRSWVYNLSDSIGVGTSSPDEKFHVYNGQLLMSRSSSYDNHILFSMPAAAAVSEHEGLKFRVAGVDKAFVGYSSNSLSPSVLRLSGNGSNANDLTISSTGYVGLGTNDPQEKLHVQGSAILNASSATLQLQTAGVDKGFVQLSGDDIRVGTYSGNTNGKFIVRTSGYNQMEVDGTLGINVMRLYAAGSHKASLTTNTNDNLSINTVNPNSQLQLNNEVYIDISNSRTGFGTPNPEERLHVYQGNLKITAGKLLTNNTGDFDMMPLCYGRINANGTIYSATNNVTVSRPSAGTYEITCSGVTASSVINVTVYGSTRYIGSGEYLSPGKMRVTIENIKEVIDDPDGFHGNDDKTFYFVIYN